MLSDRAYNLTVLNVCMKKNWLNFLRSCVDRILKPTILLACTIAIAIGIYGAIANPAYANLQDDRYDGNIFALYGGNGSIVPAKTNLAESLRLGKPALLTFYVDDSYDCKLYTPVINDVQAFHGKAVSIIPIPVDGLDPNSSKANLSPTDEAYYYRGFVPQTVLISPDGKVLFDREGKPDFADIEAVLSQIPGLPAPDPRIKSRNPNAKQVNEVTP